MFTRILAQDVSRSIIQHFCYLVYALTPPATCFLFVHAGPPARAKLQLFGMEDNMGWNRMDWNRKRLLKRALGLLSVGLLVLMVAATDSPIRSSYPEDDMGRDSLAARKKAQLETFKQFKVFHQFQFTDKLKESGITFVYHAVDDITKHMRMGHYDHGSAVAVADVDGDGLYDIYFVNQVGGNELWKNLGGGKFKNITQEAGVGLPGRISVGAAFADIENDGSQDLFVTTVRGGNVLFKNDGHGHFKDITQEAGLGLVAHSSGAFFFDYDNDGLVDLLVCNVGKYTYDEKGPNGEYVGIPNAFCIQTVTNIPSSTKTWGTTGSRTLRPKWD
jgi:hypothetical protein